MIRYMKADLHRISRRIPRYISLLCVFAVLVILMLVILKGKTPFEIVDLMTKIVPYLCGIFGLLEYIFVYSDDLKAKTMQIAIGTGISRRRVVLAKWIETAVLCILDILMLIILILVCSALKGAVFSGEPVRDLCILFFFGLIKVLGAVGFTMIFVFWTQNASAGMLLFLAFMLGIVNLLFDSIASIGPLEGLHLSSFLFSNLLDAAKSRLIIGTFSPAYFLGLIIYLAAFYFITVKLFERCELEF